MKKYWATVRCTLTTEIVLKAVLLNLLVGCGAGKPLQTTPQTSRDSATVPSAEANPPPSTNSISNPVGANESTSLAITANGVTGIYFHTNRSNVTISWTAKGVKSCSLNLFGETGLNGNHVLSDPQETSTFKITCLIDESTALSAQVVVVVPRVSITANGVLGRYTKAPTADVTLSWNASGVQSCSLSPSGQSGLLGSYTIPNQGPLQSTIYTITCSLSATESISDSVTVDTSTASVPEVTIKANNTFGTLLLNGPTEVLITWSASGVSGCLVSPFNRTDLVGAQTIVSPGPTSTTTYEISCTVAGAAPISAQVKVILPTLNITANGISGSFTRITPLPITLAWNGNGVNNCTLAPNNVGVASSGSIVVPSSALTSDTMYFVTCAVGVGGPSITASVTVAVPPAPLFSESFDTEVTNLTSFRNFYPSFTTTANSLVVSAGALRTKGRTELVIPGYSSDIIITSDMTKNNNDGSFNIGIEVGERGFIFHPGWSGIQNGAFRVTNVSTTSPTSITSNIDMGYVPSTTALNHVQVRQRPSGIFNITIADGVSPSRVFNYNHTALSSVGGAIRLVRSPGNIFTEDDLSHFDNFKVKYAAELSSTPARSNMIDFGTMSTNGSKLLPNQITLQNSGLADSQIVISSYRVTGPDASRFSVPDFTISTLTRGGTESVVFDLAVSTLGSKPYSALLTFVTNIGDISFPLRAVASAQN